MLRLQGKLLGVTELEGRGGYPPSTLLTVFDEEAGETLNLVGPREVLAQVATAEPLAEVRLDLRWKRLDLAALGGDGRGKAYRLSVVRASVEQ